MKGKAAALQEGLDCNINGETNFGQERAILNLELHVGPLVNGHVVNLILDAEGNGAVCACGERKEAMVVSHLILSIVKVARRMT
jgi:hypothetical protein